MKMCVIMGWKLVGQEFMSKPSKADLGLGELYVSVTTIISKNTLDRKASMLGQCHQIWFIVPGSPHCLTVIEENVLGTSSLVWRV